MFKFKTNHHAVKARKQEKLPELTVFFEEFKKLSKSNPLYVVKMPAVMGGTK